MARCNNAVLLNKIGMKNLTNQTEIDIRVRKDLPDCKRINTKKFDDISGQYRYNQFLKPANQFECMRKGCVNTGTLFTEETDEDVIYHARYDAVDFAAGVITFYVKVDNMPATVTVTISDGDTFTNADVYTTTITASMVTSDGFVPVVIDLSATPSSEEGTGWQPTHNGAWIKLSADKVVGYSSIAIFDAMEDFELLDVVKVACLTTAGSSADLELIEETCNASRYNDQITQIPFEMTGTKVTPNYWKLNPMGGKGDNTTGYIMTGVEETIESYISGGKTYGRVTLPDAYQNVCGMYAIQIADSCDVTDAQMTQLSIPTQVNLNERQYQVVFRDDGSTDILFNSVLIGSKVLISYPKEVEIEERVFNPDNLGDTHTSIVWTKYQDDQIKIVDIFENVFVTSFPMTITSESAPYHNSEERITMRDEAYARILNKLKGMSMTDEERALVLETVESERGAMTEEQYLGIKAALDKAEETVIPFPVVNDDELAVVGDANRTELRRFEYEITFEKPVYDEDGTLTGDFDIQKKKYENVFVKPRMNGRIVKLLASMLPYFYKVDENGNQVEYTQLEMIQIFGRLEESILDRMYELVAAILDIPMSDIDYMTSTSVLNTIMKFIEDNPNTAREAQLFFS